MKHPVLRVKKGSERYDDRSVFSSEGQRSEGDTSRQPPGRRRRRGLLPRMAHGSLFPVLILVVIALILLRTVPRSAPRANIAGWHAVLEARVDQEILDVGVAFSRLNEGGDHVSGTAALATILFVLPDTGEHAEAFGTLTGPRVALRSRMSYAASERTLRAIVTINGESRTLSLPLGNSFPGP